MPELKDDVRAFLDSASAVYGRCKAEAFNDRLWDETVTLVSPIEQMFLIALFVVSEVNLQEIRIGELLTRGTQFVVEPQFNVGRYKIDFGLSCDDKTPIVCVELDGHQFHDRSEPDRRYEKRRDRFLATRGFTVLHFTGAEVVKDPYAVALEAFIAATKLGEVAIHPKDAF